MSEREEIRFFAKDDDEEKDVFRDIGYAGPRLPKRHPQSFPKTPFGHTEKTKEVPFEDTLFKKRFCDFGVNNAGEAFSELPRLLDDYESSIKALGEITAKISADQFHGEELAIARDKKIEINYRVRRYEDMFIEMHIPSESGDFKRFKELETKADEARALGREL